MKKRFAVGCCSHRFGRNNFFKHAPEKNLCCKGYLVLTLNSTTFSVQESGDPTRKCECTKQKGRAKCQGQGVKWDWAKVRTHFGLW